jgi:DNA helicase IV
MTTSRDREIDAERSAVHRLYDRLDTVRERTEHDLRRARHGQTAGTPGAQTEQDAFVRLYSERLGSLNAAEHRLCFGRLDLTDGSYRYIGRIGLADDDQQPMLTDWRAPAAEGFYQATSADPRDVVRRRHIMTEGRDVVSLEDDVLNLDALGEGVIAEEDVQGGGLLMAALARRRTGRMHDIVATLQAEQDAIVRAPMQGILIVEGGPGCGKTVVALHRAAYLLYTHRDRLSRSGVLVVGPNPIFLHYIEQVLPALGETAAVLSTPGQLFPGVNAVGDEPDSVATLKGNLRMVDVVTRAVRARQRVPAAPVKLDVGGTIITATPAMFAAGIERGRASRRPHNVARRSYALAMLDILAEELATARGQDIDARRPELVADLRDAPDVRREVNLAWMPLAPQQVIAELLTDADILLRATPTWSAADRAALLRPVGSAWTPADVPLLDEAAELLGADEEADRRAEARANAERAQEAEYAQAVLEMTGTRGVSADQLIDRYAEQASRLTVAERATSDREWVFGHVVVDEAQELSPMMWRLLARRCPSLSMTVVGDLDQAATAAAPSEWADVLTGLAKPRAKGERRWRVERLTINYRTPRPFMELAQQVLRDYGRVPAEVTSIREGETPEWVPLGADPAGDLATLVDAELTDPEMGRLAIICAAADVAPLTDRLMHATAPGTIGSGAARLDAPVSVLSVTQAKGLEFDIVVVVEPDAIAAEAAQPGRDLYVALTRATRRLIIAASTPDWLDRR